MSPASKPHRSVGQYRRRLASAASAVAAGTLLLVASIAPAQAQASGAEAPGGLGPSSAEQGPRAGQGQRAPFWPTLDGTHNNPRDPDLGAVGTVYTRVGPPTYADGGSALVEGPNERYVSNRVFNDNAQNLFSENGVTQWAANWGQFVDHTIGLREDGGEPSGVAFDPDDPLEDFTNSEATLPIERSARAPGTGATNPREQVNTVSSYIDAWAVYGGTEERLEWLREGPVDGDLSNNGAKLLLTEDGNLPRATERGDAASAPEMERQGQLLGVVNADEQVVVAGDLRANENIALTMTHTLFAREHNRIVDELPGWMSEEQKFQVARRVVMATQQHITYTEFLPAMGVELPRYRGYRAGADPSVTNEFATVGYRAHSMIHGEIEMEVDLDRYTEAELESFRAEGIEVEVADDGVELAVALNTAFGNPQLVQRLGADAIASGLGLERQYRNDEQIDNQLRSVLFQLPNPDIEDPDSCLDGPTLNECFGLVSDLGTIDIFRGRDHGMPLYNDMREAYGLPRVSSFEELTGEATAEFPTDDPAIDTENPIDDPDILTFTELRDADGEVIPFDTDEAEAEAVEGDRATTLAARLAAIYDDVDDVDAFVGMVSEPHVEGTEFGPLQLEMWEQQFTALRDGDRFWYERSGVLRWVERRYGITARQTLAEVVVNNTDLEPGDVQANLFLEAP